jgi:hypothetical protein
MKATREMENAFFEALPGGEDAKIGDIQRAIQAVLDLIDPVPPNVIVITDADGDEWYRRGNTSWYHDMMCIGRSIMDVIETYGPITWNGKEEAAK